MTPNVSGGFEYLDNLTLRARRNGAPQEAWKSTLEGGARFAYRTERTEIALAPSLRLTRFLGAAEFNSNDRLVDLDASHKTERSLFKLLGRYVLDTTLSSPVDDDFDLGDDDLVRTADERWRLRVRPSWRYALSERTDFDLRVDYRAELSDDATRTDFSYTTLSTGVTHDLSQRNKVSLVLQGARFEPRNDRERVDTLSTVVGLSHAFDETLTGTANVGWVNANFRFSTATAPPAVDDSVALFGLGLRKELPLASLQADFSRTLEPSTSAGMVRRDQLKLSAIRQLTEQVAGALNFRYFKRRPLVEDAAFVDRNVARFDANVSYRLTREWSLDWRYRYSWQEDDDKGTAKGNAVLLQLRWQGPTEAISR